MAVIWNNIEIPQNVWDAIQSAKRFTAGDAIPDALLIAIAHEENGTFDCARQSGAVSEIGRAHV